MLHNAATMKNREVEPKEEVVLTGRHALERTGSKGRAIARAAIGIARTAQIGTDTDGT
jgi:hypothetical protein